VRSDVGVKVFGDDMQLLNSEAEKIAKIIQQIAGSSAVQVEQTSGLPLLNIEIDKALAAQYGLSVRSIQDVVAASIGGRSVGEILEGDRRFDFVIRLSDQERKVAAVAQLPLQLANVGRIVLAVISQVSTI